MKKERLLTALHTLAWGVFYICTTSFIVQASATESATFSLKEWADTHQTALAATAFAGGTVGGYFLRRRFKRHFGGLGCLGIWGGLRLIIFAIILLPLILVALVLGAVASIFGFRSRRNWRRRRRF
jgi:hypothetical protein